MIEDGMTLKERKRILKHLQTKTTTFTQLHVVKDAIEAHEKLEKIEQIVNDKHYSVKSLTYEIKEVLEKEQL